MRRAVLLLASGIVLGASAPCVTAAAATPPTPVACPSASPAVAATGASPSPSPTPSASTEDICAKKRALDALRTRLGENLTVAIATQDNLQRSLAENAASQRAVSDRIAGERAMVAQLADRMAATAGEIEAINRRIDAGRRQLAGLGRLLYMQPASPLLVLAHARSLREALLGSADWLAAVERSRAISLALEHDRTVLASRMRQLENDRDEHARAAAQLDADLKQLADLQDRQERSMHDLEQQVTATRAEIARLDQQSAQLAEQVTSRLEAERDRAVADAMSAVWTQVAIWLRANSVDVGARPGHSRQYRFVWPEPSAVISQQFGPSDLWFEPAYAGFPHFHTGIDLVEPEGSPVLASDDGVVAAVGTGTTGYGNYVVIAHSGSLVSLYGHLAAAAVHPGDHVQQGQPVGVEGSTGNSTGPHLHFEVRFEGHPVDPAQFLPAGAPSAFNG